MYLEVLVEGQTPVTYRLSRLEVSLGNLPTNDIVVKAASVSKKHLKLLNTDGHWFVSDQGSTNGSFLEEKQLIPGRKVEIHYGEEVRLGDKVFLTFLEKPNTPKVSELNQAKTVAAAVETPQRLNEDKTMIISLEEFQAAQAVAAEKKRKESVEKKRAETVAKQADLKRLVRASLFGLAILGLGFILNNAWNKKFNTQGSETIVKKIQSTMD